MNELTTNEAAQNVVVQKNRGGAPRGSQNHLKHGLSSLKRAWSQLGARAIDGRSKAAVKLRKWRSRVIADLGGEGQISEQQKTLIDMAVRTKFLLDSIDVWLLTQDTIINKKKKALLPVVMQRQTLADALARYLAQLGLERKDNKLDLARRMMLQQNGK